MLSILSYLTLISILFRAIIFTCNTTFTDLFIDNTAMFMLIITTVMRMFVISLQTHHVYFTLKRRGNNHFHVVPTWNARGVFVAIYSLLIEKMMVGERNYMANIIKSSLSPEIKSVTDIIKFLNFLKICFLISRRRQDTRVKCFSHSTSYALICKLLLSFLWK